MNRLLRALLTAVFSGVCAFAHSADAAVGATSAPPANASSAPATSASAPVDKGDAFQKLAAFGGIELGVPSSPAFAVLGISPDKVDHPATLHTFAASLARGLGQDGKAVDGMAIDVNPLPLFFPEKVRGGDKYAGDDSQDDLKAPGNFKRIATRTTFSLGTTSAEPDGASRMAWGLRVGFIDQSDPGLFWGPTAECLRLAPAKPLVDGKNKGDKSVDDQPADVSINKCDVKSGGNSLKLKDKRPLWARFSLYGGYGQSWYSKSGKLTDRASDVKAMWLSTSYGMFANDLDQTPNEWRSLVQGYLERKINDRTRDPNDDTKLVRQDSTQGIARLRAGKSNLHVFAELGASRVKLAGETTEKLKHFAWGLEYRVFVSQDKSETWVQVAGVNERGFANGKDVSGVTVNFKFGMPFLELPGAP